MTNEEEKLLIIIISTSIIIALLITIFLVSCIKDCACCGETKTFDDSCTQTKIKHFDDKPSQTVIKTFSDGGAQTVAKTLKDKPSQTVIKTFSDGGAQTVAKTLKDRPSQTVAKTLKHKPSQTEIKTFGDGDTQTEIKTFRDSDSQTNPFGVVKPITHGSNNFVLDREIASAPPLPSDSAGFASDIGMPRPPAPSDLMDSGLDISVYATPISMLSNFTLRDGVSGELVPFPSSFGVPTPEGENDPTIIIPHALTELALNARGRNGMLPLVMEDLEDDEFPNLSTFITFHTCVAVTGTGACKCALRRTQ